MTREPTELRVLIVDDDFHVAALHAAHVESVPGFTALPPVHDARLVSKAVADLSPDLMLVDVFLPHGSGMDLLRSVDVDAFVLSAASESATVATAFRRGALAYLLKPFDPKQLTARLRAYARYRRQLDGGSQLDQTDIDRAQRTMAGPEETTTVSSGATTEAAVLEAVTDAGEAAVMDVARRVGISRATAQRYLSQLVQSGSLRLELRYGSRGRPEHRYMKAV